MWLTKAYAAILESVMKKSKASTLYIYYRFHDF